MQKSIADGLREMAEEEKKQEKKQTAHRGQALLQSRRDTEKAEELAHTERLKDPSNVTEVSAQSSKKKSGGEDITVKVELADCRVKIEDVEDEDMVPRFSGVVSKEEVTLLDFSATGMAVSGRRGRDAPLEPVFVDNDDLSDAEISDTSEAPDTFLFADMVHHDNDSDDGSDAAAVTSELPSTAMDLPSHTTLLTELHNKNKVEKEDDTDRQWSSVGQLIAFRETSKAIGHAYLESQGLKLKTYYSGSLTFKNHAAKKLYQRGQQDAKSINVKRKLLKGKEDD